MCVVHHLVADWREEVLFVLLHPLAHGVEHGLGGVHIRWQEGPEGK